MRTILLLILTTIPAMAQLPSAHLTRYLSPNGIEHVYLRCSPKGSGYQCEVVKEVNGAVISRDQMSQADTEKSLGQFFSQLPKEKVFTPGKLPVDKWEQKTGVTLTWNVSDGKRITRGTASRTREEDGPEALAILSLEMDLTTQFLK